MTPLFEDLNGNLRGFEVNVTEKETQSTSILHVREDEHLISFLHPYYSYMLSVAAVTIGKGPFSHTLTVKTPEDGKQYCPIYGVIIFTVDKSYCSSL